MGGGGPAGVEEGIKDMSGGGPAGVVEGALKLRLERRESGVEGGEDEGTRNMAAMCADELCRGWEPGRSRESRAEGAIGKAQAQLASSADARPLFEVWGEVGRGRRVEVGDQQRQNFDWSFTTRPRNCLAAAEQPPRSRSEKSMSAVPVISSTRDQSKTTPGGTTASGVWPSSHAGETLSLLHVGFDFTLVWLWPCLSCAYGVIRVGVGVKLEAFHSSSVESR